jgi:hypothetical protein
MAKKKVAAKRGTGTIDTTSAAGIAKASAPLANPIANPTNTAAYITGEDAFGRGAAGANLAASIAAQRTAAYNPSEDALSRKLNPTKDPVDPTKDPVDPTKDPANALDKWTLEGDPIYQQAMQGGLSAFNTAKAGALFKLNAGQTALENQRKMLDQNAWDARRQLAGNYAARGMQRGAYGAFYRAQDKQNAQQVAAQTDIKDQIASLNQDFLTNYGTAGSDWLGTATGQDYRQKAIQLALQNRLTQAGIA